MWNVLVYVAHNVTLIVHTGDYESCLDYLKDNKITERYGLAMFTGKIPVCILTSNDQDEKR